MDVHDAKSTAKSVTVRAITPPTKAKAATPALSATPKRTKIAQILGWFIICGAACGIGMASSMAAGHSKKDDHDNLDANDVAHKHSGNHQVAAHDEAESGMELIDLAIRSKRYAEALMMISQVPTEEYEYVDSQLLYREALVLEGLHQWIEAAKVYQALADIESSSGWARATLGEARCRAAAGEFQASQQLLATVVLNSGKYQHSGANIQAECLMLRARLALFAIGKLPKANPFDARAIAWQPFDPKADNYLDWLKEEDRSPNQNHSHLTNDPRDALNPQQNPQAHSSSSIPSLRIHRFRWADDHIEVTAHLPKASLVDHFEKIASVLNWKLSISPGAREFLIATRPIEIEIERLPLVEFLNSLSNLAGVSWRNVGSQLEISLAGTADAEATIVTALASLRQAIAAAPEHPTIIEMKLEVCHLEYLSGSHRAAGHEYRRFIQANPHVAESAYACYNLGLIELEDGRLDLARERFTDATDRQVSSKLNELAHWWIARSYLDAGDVDHARKALESLQNAKSKEITSATTLATCLIELSESNSQAARTILSGSRFSDQPKLTATSEWFQSLIRYRHSPTALRAKNLAQAVENANDGREFGLLGAYLAALSYRDAGRPDLEARIYQRASTMSGPLGNRMAFESAEYLLNLDNRAKARQIYLSLTVLDPEGLGVKSELRLAEIALRDSKPEECIQRCRNALKNKKITESDIFAIMGKGYERLGKYRQAAMCFAGLVPPL